MSVTSPFSRANRRGGRSTTSRLPARRNVIVRVYVRLPRRTCRRTLPLRVERTVMRDAVADGFRAGGDLQRQRRPRATDLGVRVLIAAREVAALGGEREVRIAEPQVRDDEPHGSPLADGQRRQHAVLPSRVVVLGAREERPLLPDAGRAPGAEARARKEVRLHLRAVGGARPGVLDRDVERAPVSAQALRGRGGAQVRAVLGLVAGAVAVDVGLRDRLDRQFAAALNVGRGAAVGDRGAERRAVDVDGLRVADVALALLGRAADLGRDGMAARLLLDPVGDAAVVGEDVRRGEGVRAGLGRERHGLADVDRPRTLLAERRALVHEEADRACAAAGLDHHAEPREQLGVLALERHPRRASRCRASPGLRASASQGSARRTRAARPARSGNLSDTT